ncbi:MAG: leucyl aminopeptidase [Proteobacteria bacterium]|nr:leucyl aminopeptidase [Pseudomonadota bacterium]
MHHHAKKIKIRKGHSVLTVNVTAISLAKLKKTVVLFAFSGNKLGPRAAEFDKAHDGLVTKVIKMSRFHGDKGQILNIPSPHLGAIERVVVLGWGGKAKIKEGTVRKAAVTLGKALDQYGVKEVTALMGEVTSVKVDPIMASAELVEGMELGLYRYDVLRKVSESQKPSMSKLTIMVDSKYVKATANIVTLVAAQTAGCNLARDLVNGPANIVNADTLVEEAKKLADLGVKVEILRQKELEKAGLRMLLSVNKGSDVAPALIVMKWQGAGKGKPFKAVVGKGVTFDTGGYCIKPAQGMVGMKADMAGAAAVLGMMKAIAGRKSAVNVIGVCGCVENMINGQATRPSDVITAYNGKTVEINNTDAEGRLVLGDAMAYIIDKEKPAEVIDIATLTGACMVALGAAYAGLFSNSPRMVKGLQEAGESTGEKLWHLPIGPEYTKMLESKVADLSNIGGQYGGACTAAAFLSEFVDKTDWAHLDIAGVGMAEKIPGGMEITGASGFGVRLLTRYLEAGR